MRQWFLRWIIQFDPIRIFAEKTHWCSRATRYLGGKISFSRAICIGCHGPNLCCSAEKPGVQGGNAASTGLFLRAGKCASRFDFIGRGWILTCAATSNAY